MPKLSYLNEQIRAVETRYGREHVQVGPRGGAVTIDNFQVPVGYIAAPSEVKVTLIIPDGYGWGMNVSDTYIVLPLVRNTRDKGRMLHLEEMRQLRADFRILFEEQLRAGTGVKDLLKHLPDPKKWGLYWVCLHVDGDARWQYVPHPNRPSSRRATPDASAKETEPYNVGLLEHCTILRAMLDMLDSHDPAIIKQIQQMNERRQELFDAEADVARQFTFEHNWRSLTWMYGRER